MFTLNKHVSTLQMETEGVPGCQVLELFQYSFMCFFRSFPFSFLHDGFEELPHTEVSKPHLDDLKFTESFKLENTCLSFNFPLSLSSIVKLIQLFKLRYRFKLNTCLSLKHV